MPRAFGYVLAGNTHEDDSSAAQQQSIREYFESLLKDRGYEWGGFFEDAATSRNQELRSRPAGLALNLALEAGDSVIITKLDPMFTSPRALREIIKRWKEHEIHLHILAFGMDTSTLIGKEMLKILLDIADLRRSNNSEQMRESIAYRRRIGRAGSGPPPYGFKLAGKRGQRYHVPCPFTREVGKWVVKWKLMGKSWEQLYWSLFTQGCGNKKNKEWSIATLGRMFVGECRLMQESPAGRATLERWRLAGLARRGIAG